MKKLALLLTLITSPAFAEPLQLACTLTDYKYTLKQYSLSINLQQGWVYMSEFGYLPIHGFQTDELWFGYEGGPIVRGKLNRVTGTGKFGIADKERSDVFDLYCVYGERMF